MAHGGTRFDILGRLGGGSGVGSDGGPSLGVPVAALAFANVAALAHPNPLVIAVLSAVLVVTGFIWAAVVAVRSRGAKIPSSNRMLWPALIVFFGFCGTILSDIDRVMQNF